MRDLHSRQTQSLLKKVQGCVAAESQASRLGGVEDSWERGHEVKMEKVSGWIKV